MRHLSVFLGIALIGCGGFLEIESSGAEVSRTLPVPQVTSEPAADIANPLEETNPPIIAIWRDNSGRTRDTNGPCLRVALRADGRVVFARNPNVWNHDLLIGQLSSRTLAKLKREIREAQVFELKGYCYLVPDAPTDCVMVSFGGKQQMLYWDEVEDGGYGININPKPQHVAFKQAWWKINQLVLSALPSQAEKLPGRFHRPPENWYLKQKIQSE